MGEIDICGVLLCVCQALRGHSPFLPETSPVKRALTGMEAEAYGGPVSSFLLLPGAEPDPELRSPDS